MRKVIPSIFIAGTTTNISIAFCSGLLVYSSPSSVVIAADSGLFSQTGGLLAQRRCKLLRIGPELLFTAAGLLRVPTTSFDVLVSAETSALRAADPDEAHRRFGSTIQNVLQEVWRAIGFDLQRAIRSTGHNDKTATLTTYLFVGPVPSERQVKIRGGDVVVDLSSGRVFVREIPMPVTPNSVPQALLRIGEAGKLRPDLIFAAIERIGPFEALSKALTNLAEEHSANIAKPIATVEVSVARGIRWVEKGVCRDR